jgi:hypothetical protein
VRAGSHDQHRSPRKRHHPSSPGRQAAFCPTTAAVVPVMFLALAVQSHAFSELLATFIANARV